MTDTKDTVLVTGISGYIAKHVALQVAQAGYKVRGTVRNAAKGEDSRQTLIDHGVGADDIEIVEADLLSDDGWQAAVAGCRYVQHLASPFPIAIPKNPDDLIKPARDGTTRVLTHAANAGVERAVVTSSVAAILYDKPSPFDETDWADDGGLEKLLPYAASKTIAERTAWAIANKHPDLQVAVVNPGFVQGPPLDKDVESSAEGILMLMKGKYPAVPKITFSFVDVRDVAGIHLAAMESDRAAGERFAAVCGHASMLEMSQFLSKAFPAYRKKLPSREMPNFLVKAMALVDAGARSVKNQLGKKPTITTRKVHDVLGYDYKYSPEQAIIGMGEKLIAFKLV